MKTKKIICAVLGCLMIFVSGFCFVQSSREADRARVSAGTASGYNYNGNRMSAVRGAFEGAHHKEMEHKYKKAGIGTGLTGVGLCIGSFVFYKKENEELEDL